MSEVAMNVLGNLALAAGLLLCLGMFLHRCFG